MKAEVGNKYMVLDTPLIKVFLHHLRYLSFLAAISIFDILTHYHGKRCIQAARVRGYEFLPSPMNLNTR